MVAKRANGQSEASSAPGGDVRVAVVGAGPAGFYLADFLLRRWPELQVNLFESQFAPHGLVRYGVAPDHQSIKRVTRVYDSTMAHPRFRLFANVTVGRDVTIAELAKTHLQVALCTGAGLSRALGIDGEEAQGCYPAAPFVAWYNGHPEQVAHPADLSTSDVLIVGMGNVALDVARVLARPAADLASTDCPAAVVRRLSSSSVRRLHLVARRGPLQAAFTDKELRDLADLPKVRVVVREQDLPEAPAADRVAARRLAMLREIARAEPSGDDPDSRTVYLHFFRSPEALAVEGGRVTGAVLSHTRLQRDEKGRERACPTGEQSFLRAGLVFIAAGYRSAGLEGVPFDEESGTVPNEGGRVVERVGGPRVPSLYVAGWVKRGATGVIGSNKADAYETGEAMLADASEAVPPSARVEDLLRSRGVRFLDAGAWQRLDAFEVERGQQVGKPREKITELSEALERGS